MNRNSKNNRLAMHSQLKKGARGALFINTRRSVFVSLDGQMTRRTLAPE
jgi:hypothetical protein